MMNLAKSPVIKFTKEVIITADCVEKKITHPRKCKKQTAEQVKLVDIKV